MAPIKGRLTETALMGINGVLIAAAVITVLWLARDICIPIALAGLLAFLLSPLVTRLERWVGRVVSVLFILMMVSAGIGVSGYVAYMQVHDLTVKLPEYHANIQNKCASLRELSGTHFEGLSVTLEKIRQDLLGTPLGAGGGRDPSGATVVQAPVSVKVVEPKTDLATQAQALIPTVLKAFAVSGLVILVTIFMLLDREGLRGRLIRLAGLGHISATTTAMSDAGNRVFRYLAFQLLINALFGILVAIGLYFIGVPNAVLWGGMAVALRFIPYVGPWLSAFLPIAMACAASDGWTMPLLTLALFAGLELVTNNVVEPWLYGASTGISPLALVLASLTWAWLWGPVGLILATPLTVCLVVMGRHVPRLSFLRVLLSDDVALAPHEECYHRLLRSDVTEASALVESYLKDHSVIALYDEVLIPVLIAAEADHGHADLDHDRRAALHQGVRDLIEDLTGRRPTETMTATETERPLPTVAMAGPLQVACLPVRAMRDELAALMLKDVLTRQGCHVEAFTAAETAIDLVTAVAERRPEVIYVSVVSPSALVHARNLCSKLRARLPHQRIIVGFWNSTESLAALQFSFAESSCIEVVNTLAEAGRLACRGRTAGEQMVEQLTMSLPRLVSAP